MKHIIYKITAVSIVLTMLSCTNTKVPNNNNEEAVKEDYIVITKAQFEKNNMKLGKITQESFPETVTANGMIDVPPQNKAIVNATFGGYIKTTPFLIGDYVTKGQTLVTIENPEFVKLQQEYLEVYNQLFNLKATYDRQKVMLRENITSEKSFIKAESDYNAAFAKQQGIEKQLSMLHIDTQKVVKGEITSIAKIIAPISGSITKLDVNRGSYVSPATPIMEIIDNDHVHLELSVFEKDVLKIKKGQKVLFTIAEASKNSYEAYVHLIGTAIEENRTIKVHAHLKDESNHNFLTGMFVEASIITSESTKKALPNEAFVEINNATFTLLLDKEENDTYYFKQIELTTSNNANGFAALDHVNVTLLKNQFLVKGAFQLLGE